MWTAAHFPDCFQKSNCYSKVMLFSPYSLPVLCMTKVEELFRKFRPTSCTQGLNRAQGCQRQDWGVGDAAYRSPAPLWVHYCSASHRVQDSAGTPNDAVSVRTRKMNHRHIFLHTVRKIILHREMKSVVILSQCAVSVMMCPSNQYFSFNFTLLLYQSEGK